MTTMSATDTSPPPLGPSLSDEELMGQLAAGRQDALGPLHGRYASLVFNLAAQTLDRATAEEIVQDVFVAVWRKAGTFDPARGTFRAWVLRIAHLRVLNELRRRGRRPRVEPDPEGLRLASVPEPGPGPAEEAWLRAPPRDRPRGRRGAAAAPATGVEPGLPRRPHPPADRRLPEPPRRDRQDPHPRRTPDAPRPPLPAVRGGPDRARRGRRHAPPRASAAFRRSPPARDIQRRRPPPHDRCGRYPRGNARQLPRPARRPLGGVDVLALRAAPARRAYLAWGEFGGRWVLLGTVHRKEDGSDLLIAEGPHLKSRPRALKVTLEPLGTPHAPNGPPVIVWPNP